MQSNDEPRAWKCRNGHVLGVVTHSTNGQGLRRLLLYRHAIDLEAEEMGQPEVMAVLDGLGGLDQVACDVPGCGAVRDWNPDAEAVEHLIRAVRGVVERGLGVH